MKSGAARAATTGSLSIASASYGAQQNIGVKLVTVNRTGGASGSASVVCKTVDNTAVAGLQFTAVTQTLTWANGNAAPQYCHIPILNTTPFLGGRTLFVELSSPTGATLGAITQGTLTIYGDAPNSKVALSSAAYSVAQNAGSLTITVARTGYTGGKASVGYATANGSAAAGVDYTAKSGQLTWNYGDGASKTFVIPVSNAAPFSGNKKMTVAIAGATGTAIGTASAIVTIAGDVTAITVPPVPSGLALAPGNTQVSLAWSASSGATSYDVKRATTSGGPYTQVGVSTSTSYTDSSLTNGTTYYYVVSGVNSTGESPDSLQVMASSVAAVSVAGLHVSGNKILNGQNQPVPLRGVDKSGTEYMCLGGPQVFDGPSDAASVATLGTWAINIVRLPVNEDCWLGINGVAVGGTAYQTAVVNYVNLLSNANIATIIDLQWAAPGTTLSNQLTPMPDSDHAPAFWASVANTFKSNRSVLFDLFNEPYPDSNQDSAAAWACLKNGGTCPGVSYQAASTQSLVNAIRATGSTNVIMVPGVQYTNTLTLWLANKPTDPSNNLVASWHSYADQICNNQTCWDRVIKPVLQSVPLITGEMGESDCQDTYVNPLMTYLDANGGNYLAWAWNTYDCSSFPSLISAYDGTPTGFGLGVRNHFLASSGKTAPPPPAIPFFSSTYPFGIAVGSTSQHIASDGTVYHPDVANAAMTESMQFFTPFTTNDTIAGTPDPTLYKSGKSGAFGIWTINVPNGNYSVTLGVAPNTTYAAGPYGQDQTIQGQKVGTCVWSSYSGSNVFQGTACPQGSEPVPVLDHALTVTYTISVYNQQLTIEPAASFGGGRTTILNTIKIAQAP